MPSHLDLFLTFKELSALLGISHQAVGKIVKQYNIPVDHKNQRTQILRGSSIRAILELKGIKYPKVTIGMHIVKGGVGKTTLTHGFASRAAAMGFRVLMIDLDQQANLSSSFGLTPVLGKDPSMLEVISKKIGSKKISVKDAIKKVDDFLDIIPATMSLSTLDATIMVQQHNVETLFKKALGSVVDNYDFIIFDCPPALSLTTTAVHCFTLDNFAQHIVMPLAPEEFSREGLITTLTHFQSLVEKHDVAPEVDVVLNMMDLRTNLAVELIKEMHDEYREILNPHYIAIDQGIKNSLREKKCIWSRPNKATEDINTVLIELLNLEIWKEEWKTKKYTKELKKSGRARSVEASNR